MKTITFRQGFILFLLLFFSQAPVLAQGYYKDVFMNGGVCLESRTNLAAASYLELSLEYLATGDQDIQNRLIIADEHDENGVLLYPDGEPRFRMLQTNGGTLACGATVHGKSLGSSGRNRIRTFFNHGGSYTGTCGGAYLCSKNIGYYYGIWPGYVRNAQLEFTPTGHFIPQGSALLQYFDFGGDLYIDNVFHNDGCYAINYISATEVLLRYDYPPKPMHQQPSCWAYKKDTRSGRLVVIGSHPEIDTRGEPLELMVAMMHYAIDGVGAPSLKDTLSNGEMRLMDKFTGDNDPAFTRIGDKQYHHFMLEIPPGAGNLTVTLDGEDNYDLNLYLKNGDFAFKNAADYADTSAGADKTINLSGISPGNWYVGVECQTTVGTILRDWGYEYTGKLAVLNGVAYSIGAEWDVGTAIFDQDRNIEGYFLAQNYPNPFNPATNIGFRIADRGFVTLTIYNMAGEKVATLVAEELVPGSYTYPWDARGLASGLYFYRLKVGDFTKSRKMLLIR